MEQPCDGKIYGTEMAENVRDDYIGFLKIGYSAEDAENGILEAYNEYILPDGQDAVEIWLSLAYIEWKNGRLSLRVKDKALSMLSNGKAEKAWIRETSTYLLRERQRALNKFKKDIESPMPDAKPYKKYIGSHAKWQSGDVLLLDVSDNDMPEYALLQIVQVTQDPICKAAPDECWDDALLMSLLSWKGDYIPDISDLYKLDYIILEERKAFPVQSRKSVAGDLIDTIAKDCGIKIDSDKSGSILSRYESDMMKSPVLYWEALTTKAELKKMAQLVVKTYRDNKLILKMIVLPEMEYYSNTKLAVLRDIPQSIRRILSQHQEQKCKVK